jgi:hypothetical protein
MAANGQSGEISDGLVAARLQQVTYRCQIDLGGERFRGIRRIHRALTSDPLILSGKVPDSGRSFVRRASAKALYGNSTNCNPSRGTLRDLFRRTAFP